MQKIISLLFVTGLLAIASLTISAQDEIVAKQQLTDLKDNAYKKLKTQTYRVKMTGESFRDAKDSKPSQFSTEISEYAPPDSHHIIFERKNDEGTVREERISIGNKRYIKLNNESWREIVPSNGGIAGPIGIVGTRINNEESVEYKYKGKAVINKQKADLYEVKTIRKYESLKTESIYTERFWFDQNGLFLKNETEMKINNKLISLTTREYEYNLKIKIEAPKMN